MRETRTKIGKGQRMINKLIRKRRMHEKEEKGGKKENRGVVLPSPSPPTSLPPLHDLPHLHPKLLICSPTCRLSHCRRLWPFFLVSCRSPSFSLCFLFFCVVFIYLFIFISLSLHISCVFFSLFFFAFAQFFTFYLFIFICLSFLCVLCMFRSLLSHFFLSFISLWMIIIIHYSIHSLLFSFSSFI